MLGNRTLLDVAGPLPLPQAENRSAWLEARLMVRTCSHQPEKAETPSNIIMPEDCVDERAHLDWLGFPSSGSYPLAFKTFCYRNRAPLPHVELGNDSDATPDWWSKKPYLPLATPKSAVTACKANFTKLALLGGCNYNLGNK